MLLRFWRQPNRAYRNMELVLAALTLNFVIPSMSYFFAPELAVAQFRALGSLLGGVEYPFSEQSHLWRVLAAGNVFTLGAMCFMLLLNVKRFAAIMPAFVILKAYTALGYLYVFLFELRYRLFFAVFLFDALAVFLVLFFGRRALRAIEAGGAEGEALLVPGLFLK